MSDDRPLAVGDRVQWTTHMLWGDPRTNAGTVTFLSTGGLAIVEPDNGISEACVALTDLRRLPLTGSVAAIAECRAERDAEVSATVFERVADDYDFMMRQANSLGGVELI